MKTLLIDNYDSFTYNLFQLLAEANDEEPIVVRNDELSWAELAAGLEFDNVVISPGPGHPDREADFGVCAAAIREAEVPLLGVCLGHQGLCSAYGAEVVHAPEAMHGRLSAVTHEDGGLFAGLPREFQVVRYHSLCVVELPEELEATAWTSDGILMGVAHRSRPQWGLQFHPESISTEHGRAILGRFGELTGERSGRRKGGFARAGAGVARSRGGGPELELRVERLDSAYDTERAFHHLYGASEDAFWLDSSALDGRARFSFIGDGSGPLASTVSYDVGRGELTVTANGRARVLEESIFDYLSREMRRLRHRSDQLPFDFNCGFAGYFGYELKADVDPDAEAQGATMPDAWFVFADRMIAFDHVEDATYVLGICPRGECAATDGWIAETALRLASLPPIDVPEWSEVASEREPVRFELARSHAQYLEDIAECKRQLSDGESYEICLTNAITAAVSPEPLPLYRTLRRVNPAPFCAYLRVGEAAVLSSSPERFLAIGRDRWAEAKPIKGTVRRGAEPAEDVRLAEELRSDEKSRAENLMICDLLRNDLGRVSEIGTVHVPSLMQIESYETVHQLVSTVRGLLREELEPPDCIRACFPGGSMTGAPKKRTMEIIDQLEGAARGVYSGAIGYLGLSGGCDLSIVIRAVVMDGETTTLGVGGAIVMQSDAEQEYEEILLKGLAPMQAIDPRVDVQAAFESSAV